MIGGVSGAPWRLSLVSKSYKVDVPPVVLDCENRFRIVFRIPPPPLLGAVGALAESELPPKLARDPNRPARPEAGGGEEVPFWLF